MGVLKPALASVACGKQYFPSVSIRFNEKRYGLTLFRRIMTDTSVEVSVQQGRIRGVVENSIHDVKYFAFRGIPYAQPPVNDLRFLDPLPPTPWTGIRDASTLGGIAAQFYLTTREYVGGDDCLYLNVYTKSLEKQSPVMVWIHGGGFVYGSGDPSFYGPDYLIDKDIVLVTINYRLGVLGFLNLEDEIAPGNQGLKDQVMALKWVRDNIKKFGGDPENVTIFGESAGGASVHYLTISPLSQGLFHKAISQSAAVCCPWASMLEEPKKYAYMLVEKLGKKCSNSQEIVDYLRTLDTSDIVQAQTKLLKVFEEGKILPPFGPGIDSKSENPFMPRSPLLAMKTGVKVPFLLGYNSDEGLLFCKDFDDNRSQLLDSNIDHIIPTEIKIVLKEKGMTVSDLKRIYFGSEPISERSMDKFVQLMGDIHFVRGVHDTIEAQIENQRHPTYFYIFSYDQGFSMLKTMFNINESGTCHGDDLMYLFFPHMLQEMGFESLQKGTTAYRTMQYFTEMWSNFAKTGNPTPSTTSLIPLKWTPIDNSQSYNYLAIGEQLEMKTLQATEHRANWRKKNKL